MQSLAKSIEPENLHQFVFPNQQYVINQIKNSMRNKILFTLSLAFTSLLLVNCSNSKKAATATSTMPSLKKTFEKDFLIGTALSAQQIEEKDSGAARLIPQQFNSATPENIMKAQLIHPGWDKYNFDLADKLVAYAKKNDIKVTAHTLIWHSQTPAFLRGIKDADSIKQYFVNHINTVASRYDGKVYSWDVVNEALNEDGSLRNSIFRQKLGLHRRSISFGTKGYSSYKALL